VGRPALLFLDEPTTGLDPQARRQLWEIIRALRSEGRTVLITTHYMDEAERLCDRVAIIDRGRVIALGTPAELIASLGGDHIVEFGSSGAEAAADCDWCRALPSVREVRAENTRLCLTVSEPHVTIPALLEQLQQRGSALQHLTTRQASLDDVFMSLTGRHFQEGQE
jgi:ABC-2 type transport system ATP-binding protein